MNCIKRISITVYLFIQIRKQAIKEFPTLVRASTDTLQRVVSVLIQLLQANDTSEVTQVQNSIMTIYHINPKGKLNEKINIYLFYFNRNNQWNSQ